MIPAVPSQASRAEIPPGARFGRYTVVRRLATGGMAEVYLGRAEGIRGFVRPVALKLVLPHLARDARFITLFEHEAKIAAHLDHPNIIQIHELGRERDDVFIAMEYVHGHTLREVLGHAQGPLPLACALFIVITVCSALHHAHTACDANGQPLSIVHRDVSPSNVMVRADGLVKVVDFGIAKAMAETSLTQTGTVKGKTGYMSPEQCRGERLDARSDVFNLGILLYETTTGRRAFGGTNMFEVMNRINDGRYLAPSEVVDGYPTELQAIVDGVLATDPAERPATALALREQLDQFARGIGLHPSELEVSAWLSAHMNPPLPVDLELETLPSMRRSPGRRVAVVGLSAAGLTAAMVAMVVASASEEPGSSSVEGDQPSAATAEVTSATETTAANSPSPASTDGTTGVDGGEPEPASTTDASEASDASRTPPKRRKGRRRRGAKKADRDPLFPWMNEG